MATTPATVKQIKFLEQLTGKDYSDAELTASEASKKIETALANKGEEVAKLPAQSKDEILPEHLRVIEEAVKPIDHTRKSIERQVSLYSAKDWCIAKVQAGVELNVYDVLVVAKVFESYLETGVVVEKKK